MGKRRNIFGPAEGEGQQPASSLPPFLAGDEGPGAIPGDMPEATSVVDQLRFADKRQRRRPWDERNRAGQVSYRGIPPEILQGVRDMAQQLNVSVDDAARACLEYGLSAYQAGELILRPEIKSVRMTLFPEPEQAAGKFAPKRSKKSPARWKTVVSYRGIPAAVRTAVNLVAEERSVPVGEVAAVFLQYGVQAFAQGRMQVKPVAKTAGKTLFGGNP